MSRTAAIDRATAYFDDGGYFDDLARRVAIPTESQEPDRRPDLFRYLTDEMTPSLEALGFTCEIHENSLERGGPFLVAHRHESVDVPTIMSYGHGDVVRGYDDQWTEGAGPWVLTKQGERWYGRGTADNKGQHSINIAALGHVLAERGALGFNVVMLIETGEETGSPGLREFCDANRDLFVDADALIASDGPRLVVERPTIFGGTRGALNFDLELTLRDGGHHSGNWGGLLANPGTIMAHAIASIISPTGEILVPEWRPEEIPDSVRAAVHDLTFDAGPASPDVDPDWGEPGLTAGEKVFAWNTFEVLAYKTGNPDRPVNAIPPSAIAHCHMRYVVPTEVEELLPALRRHLDNHGFEAIEIRPADDPMAATRLDPDHPWAKWAVASVEATTGKKVDVVPNLGGSLPNDVFADLLGLPTIWVPHSYGACSQHAPNEHILEAVTREALQIMTGLFWDLGASTAPTQ